MIFDLFLLLCLAPKATVQNLAGEVQTFQLDDGMTYEHLANIYASKKDVELLSVRLVHLEEDVPYNDAVEGDVELNVVVTQYIEGEEILVPLHRLYFGQKTIGNRFGSSPFDISLWELWMDLLHSDLTVKQLAQAKCFLAVKHPLLDTGVLVYKGNRRLFVLKHMETKKQLRNCLVPIHLFIFDANNSKHSNAWHAFQHHGGVILKAGH